MKTIKDYVDYSVEKACEILAIPSPSGYTQEAADWLIKELKALGYKPKQTIKGGVTVDIGGKDEKNALLLSAHMDTLGGMVHEVKSNGRLKITGIGCFNPANGETENCIIQTKFSGKYEGTLQLINASTHVNKDFQKTERTFDSTEVVIDEDVSDAEDVQALGIQAGDFVCFEPRTRVTKSGYIKSRYLDDKLSCGMLLGYAKFLKDNNIVPARKIYMHFTCFEEVGYGANAYCPKGVTEAICVDMGCVGEGLTCTERMVSICAKDSSGPYHYDTVKGLEEAAIRCKADYAVDIYPDYVSDVAATIAAGFDIKHGCIGAGVYASHGYERSHKDGVMNTLMLVDEYVGHAE
ncbi:MAG: M42 family metallopeptidase [Clostridia bacterium]|nr:M42 family metallopeptidase [Clostridia bacterium]